MFNSRSKNRRPYPLWHEVEQKIREEMFWLKNSIPTFRDEKPSEVIKCTNCLLRSLAMMIVTGEIRANEIIKKPPLTSFWNDLPPHHKQKKRPPIKHGQKWHRDMMTKIENHFLHDGFRVVREPEVNGGMADLGIYKRGHKDMVVEIGTTSYLKLLLNLMRTKNVVYTIVPDDDRIIELERLKPIGKILS